MNIVALIGLLIGFGGVIAGYMLDEGVLSALIKLPAICTVVVGTLGIGLIANPLSRLKKVPAALKLVFLGKKQDTGKLIDTIVEISVIARKSGLLALEAEAAKYDNPVLKKGLNYLADGVPPDRLKMNLEAESDSMYEEYEEAAKVFEALGGTSPTMGVLGTVMGMVSILKDLGGDGGMDTLGAKIASAFIATMYGVGFANLIYLPLGNHIKAAAERENSYYKIMIEGLVSIQAGEYPARIKEYLVALSGPSNSKKMKGGKEIAE
ncbi:MAG: MotA/TolQ/ExbB proton channel family protein [Oscillospiraceae bacterium]